jgi:hypothetical protein
MLYSQTRAKEHNARFNNSEREIYPPNNFLIEVGVKVYGANKRFNDVR